MSPAEQHERNQLQPEPDGRNHVLRGGTGNVDKIRDILFSTQMRDYESRFARLEETVNKETLEIRETNRRRFDQLEGHIRKEFEGLQSRIKSERDERSVLADRQSRDLKDLSETLGRRVRDLDDRSGGAERSLREDMLRQAKDMTQEAQARQDGIASLLDRRFHELREGKTDRAALAALFMEMALRLSDQFQIPAAEESPAGHVSVEAFHPFHEEAEKIVLEEKPPEPPTVHAPEAVQSPAAVQSHDTVVKEEEPPRPEVVVAPEAVQSPEAVVKEEKPPQPEVVAAPEAVTSHDTVVQKEKQPEPEAVHAPEAVQSHGTVVAEEKPAEQAKAEPRDIPEAAHPPAPQVLPEEPADPVPYRKAANQGDARAQLNLGYMYQTGKDVPQDDAQAAAWFRKAAEQGNAEAEYVLGGLYYEGHGVARDLAQATSWYRKAADQGNASAQVTLGVAYLTGEGVLQSYGESYFWIKLAAGGTVPDVKPEDLAPTLDAIAIHLTPDELAQSQKRVREWLKVRA